MAEPLSLVASVIAIIQISKTVIGICQFYIEEMKEAPSELRLMLVEISTLRAITKNLRFLVDPKTANPGLSNQLVGIDGPVEGCLRALKELEKELPHEAALLNGKGSKRRKVDVSTWVRALAWPLRVGKVKRLLQDIMLYKGTINLALTTDLAHDLKDVKQKTEQIHTILTDTECREIYTWLQTTNPSDIHNRSQILYEAGTGSWMLRTPEWPLWIEGKHRCLWIHGIPGAGKSILASYLAKEIEEHCKSSSSGNLKLGHAYYYCYFGHNQDESTHILRWIIGQLCRQSKTVPKELQDVFKSGKTPSLVSLLSILCELMNPFHRVYIILDAVDESMPRDDLLRTIRDLSTDPRFASIALLVTSREYIDIEVVMNACSTPIGMSNPFVEEDIRTLVRATLQSDSKYRKWPKILQSEMEDTIPRKAEGMFRWAVCQLDILKRLKPDVSNVMTTLSNLPKTLDETYERILLSVPEDERLILKHVFHWMVHHNSLFGDYIPFSTLLYAVRQSTENFLSTDIAMFYDLEGLRELCGCLVMVERVTINDIPNNYEQIFVTFAHYTVLEYLQSPRIQQIEVGYFSCVEEKTQNDLLETTFRQALAIQSDMLPDDLSDTSIGFCHRLDGDFNLYCVRASVIQLTDWNEEISKVPILMELGKAFLNPFRPGYKCFTKIISRLPEWNSSEYVGKLLFWNINWLQDSNSDAITLFGFLLLDQEMKTCHLVHAFLRNYPVQKILTQQLHFTAEVSPDGKRNISPNLYEFVGTIPDIVSQTNFFGPSIFDSLLDLISESGVHLCDVSTPLLIYGSGYNLYREYRIFQKLLDLGANANGPKDSFVTPLQMAVVQWELDIVETLLNAGADPNALGSGRSGWDENSPMGRFNHLHGHNVLHIIRNVEAIQDYVVHSGEKLQSHRDKIEKLLLRFGAVEAPGKTLL